MGVSKRRHLHTWAFLIRVILDSSGSRSTTILFVEDFLHPHISTTPDATTGILSITRLVFKFRVRGIDQSQTAKIYGGANLAFVFSFPVRQHITTTFPLPKTWLPFPNIHDVAPKYAERLTIRLHHFLSQITSRIDAYAAGNLSSRRQ